MNHLILGEQEFFADRIRRKLSAGLSTTVIRASEISQHPELLGATLFSEPRAVVITHCQDVSKATMAPLFAALEDKQEDLTLILMHNDKGRYKSSVLPTLKKLCTVHQVPTFDYKSRIPWVIKEFSSHGVRVNQEIAETVLDAVGSDPREIAAAIAQLCADTEVTVASVRAYYGATAEVSGFTIADAVIQGDITAALRSTRRALQLGVAPALIIVALTMKLGMIAKVFSSRQPPADINDAPWKIQQAMRQSRRWNARSIAQAMVILAETDAALKGRGGEPEYEIEQAVLSLARLAA